MTVFAQNNLKINFHLEDFHWHNCLQLLDLWTVKQSIAANPQKGSMKKNKKYIVTVIVEINTLDFDPKIEGEMNVLWAEQIVLEAIEGTADWPTRTILPAIEID